MSCENKIVSNFFKLFQNCFKIVSKLFQNCFKIVSKLFQNCFKIVSNYFNCFIISNTVKIESKI